MSALDGVMLTQIPQGAAIRVTVVRRGENLDLTAELVVMRGHAESARILHERSGPDKHVLADLSRWIDENRADMATRRTS